MGSVAGLLLAPRPGGEMRGDARTAAAKALQTSRRAVATQRANLSKAADAGWSAYRQAVRDLE